MGISYKRTANANALRDSSVYAASGINKEACVIRVVLKRTTEVEPEFRETPGVTVIQGLVGGGGHVKENYMISYTLHSVYLIH